ncbi:uncharacterized protein B0H64DRAFT_232308 [Chaetomium fimeti]|uniref:Uncharacterized protein n=1 Tax=Chaetomium fimeti TaxID=1854472 RepID=A0AAE0HA15_9PEZI|nr:hypothetical protein B0H64DRAFT_232308 [Chaetomium fimeti]
MAVEGATQALVAAFFFGIVLNAASAALVLYVKGYGLSAVFRDSQRLVLVLFLLSAALWAQIDFITVLLDISTSSMPCQIGIIFSTTFDQFARFSVEQFLLWALNNNNGAKLSLTQLIPQVLVLVRFLAGAVFIGFTRPQTDDFCLATTSALPVGILVAGLDGAIVLLLIIRAYSAGGAAKENRDGKGVDADRARALMAVLLGLVFWTGTSVPMLLGFETLALATRTALPAGGLLVVIIFVASGAGTLLTSRATGSRPPEAPSPRRINISRDISTSDTDYPPTRFEDLKEAAIRSSRTFVNPRDAPRVKDETSIGFDFGAEGTRQAEPMPPLPANISHKPNAFHLTKGKMTISHPIVQQNDGQNPWSKIAVVDLKEAAVAERERRARMQEEENVTVSRPAWVSMDLTPEEALKRGVSLKRKEVASASIRESLFPGALQPEDAAVAVTTSAQLSPGGEETRRRSPRPSPQEEPVQPRQASPVQATQSPDAESQSPQNHTLAMQQPLPRSNIRPSRMLPPSPTTPPPEPTKTPLQRRPTIGLPSNPRARGLAVTEEPGSQHRTILFVNNIEYNDPAMVQAIIKTAGHPSTKPAPVAETPGTSRSVVNRPRPIPRKPADSPAESSPALSHRRTKSGGSVMGRKSLLAPSPGSPTTLPPLPVLPRSATVGARPHPNNTKSMTFQEKVTLLFPSPPSSNAIKRRSSLPDVPPIPASYWDIDSSPSEPYGRQHSNRTTQASTRTESVLEVDEISRNPKKTRVNAGEAGSSWLRALGDEDGGDPSNNPRVKEASGKRGSSPVLPGVPARASAWTETTYDRSEDDGTNWSSINTPEVAIGVPVMQRLGLPSSVRMPGRQDMRGSELSFADNRSRETLPIMLDTSTVQQFDRQSPMVSEVDAVVSPVLPTWHRRVGDVCPTFSDRAKKVKARKMPPPAPLPLHTLSTKKILAVQVEPSPLESPGQAIQQIQAQLKKLDELEQPTPESASRRIALLEDLEREMGQQEEHWEEIKHDIGRDSLSSMQTTSPTAQDSRHASVASTINMAREPTRKSIGAERRASRLAHMQNAIPIVPEPPVRNSVSPQMSKWQKRLTEAQMDYMDARLLRASNVNFLQLTRAQLASPTPPDSDDSEVPPLPSFDEGAMVGQPSEAPQESALLWTPASKDAAPTSFLWAATSKPSPEIDAPLPALSVRPAQRKEWAPLQIKSAQLWRKPYNTANRATSGLWRPLWASAAPPAEPLARVPSKSEPASQKAPRPVTQRPPRRNKRVTLLPDILESPKPLPDKRGTLGIFQFPWGEKSDTARVQPRPSVYMAMPGTMSSGTPSIGMAGRSIRPESDEYSSSFFDDYDDEDDIMGMDSDEDGDDGFDETTLWEIASLLKTDEVPSRNSLLPPPSEPVVDDYLDELPSDDEGQSIVIGLAEPLEALAEQQRDSATLESSALLMLEDAIESKTAPKQAIRIGLPANPKASLNSRAALVAPQATPEPEMSRMPRHTAEVQKATIVQKKGSVGLWHPPSQADTPSAPGGLFVFEARRSDGRGTSEEPAAMHMSRKSRPAEQKSLERLASTDLWTSADARKKSERNWILGAKTKHRGSRLQRQQTTPEDWKAALSKAIAASYPSRKKLNRITTPAQWEAALQEAIAASYPSRKKLNRTISTPRVWEAALQEAISLSTRQQSSAFNPAIRHPVFFGSLTITCPEEAVHPAIPAPSAKKLHRPSSNSRSRSRSTSRTQRKEEVRAVEHEVHTSSDAPPPVPATLQATFSHNSAIQAQIEALEQERLFAERTAKAEYHRRTSMAAAAVAEPVVAMEEEVTGVETVQDLQRRLSLRIRQSLVFTSAPIQPKAPEPPVVVAAPVEVARFEPRRKSEPRKDASYLWIPHSQSVAAVSTTGLWLPAAKRDFSTSPSAEEDAIAASQRAHRREMLQKKQLTQEILAQMAAVERGENPFVHFAKMDLWVNGERAAVARASERDWLHNVCAPMAKKQSKGKQLWTSSLLSNNRSLSRTSLWTPMAGPQVLSSEEEDANHTGQSRRNRRRQEPFTPTTKVPQGVEMWTKSTVSPQQATRQDWLHSVCAPVPTSASTPGGTSKQLWAPYRPSSRSDSTVHLWPGTASSVSSLLPMPTARAGNRNHRRQDKSAQPARIERRAAMWTKQSVASAQQKTKHDWLHSVCTPASTSPSTTGGVTKQLWASHRSSNTSRSASTLHLWPGTASSASSPREEEYRLMATVLTGSGKNRRRQETLTQPAHIDQRSGMWTKQSVAAAQQKTKKHDWLHSVRTPTRTSTSATGRVSKQLWAARRPSNTSSSASTVHLWPGTASLASSIPTAHTGGRKNHRRQATPTQPAHIKPHTEMWTKQQSVVTAQQNTKHDWLHTVCTPTSTPTSPSSHATSKHLWTTAAPRRRSGSAPGSVGLWSETTATAANSSSGLVEAEDGFAMAARGRRRKAMQEMVEMQEVLARIAAIERGEDVFVDDGFRGAREGMWSVGVNVRNGMGVGSGGRRDWLHSVCVRRTRGVVLRY